jgi:hypothetical protein
VAAEDVSVAEVWKAIERVVPRGQVTAALAAVWELAPLPDEQAAEAWRAELLKRHATIRPFLPTLTEASFQVAGFEHWLMRSASPLGAWEGPPG